MNKKILIATGIYPPDIGGPASIIAPLADSLRANGFVVKIITYSGVDNLAGEKNVYRVRKNKFFSRFIYFLTMVRLAFGVDLIYATDTYSVGYFAYLIKKLFGKKYIIRFAGDAAWETAVSSGWTNDYIVDFQNKIYDPKIEQLKKRRRTILVKANGIVAVSRFIGGVAKQIGVKPEKIKLIYNSVDFISSDSNVSAVAEIRKKYGPDKKIIVTACRLTAWKGVDGIIKSLPDLKKDLGDLVFLILGDGPEMSNLKKLAQDFKVESEIKFLGSVPHQAVADYFKAADLFILNTNYEALSHTLLEAMKAGVPIIATDIGGNPEVIENGKNGLLIGYNNLEELKSAAIKILTDSQLAKLFVANAKEKLKIFNWEKMVEETTKVLREL